MLMRVLILSRGGDRQADVAIVAGETGGVEPPDHAPCWPLGWSLGGSVGELGGTAPSMLPPPNTPFGAAVSEAFPTSGVG